MLKKLLLVFFVCSLTVSVSSCNRYGCPGQQSLQQSKKGSKKAKKKAETGLFGNDFNKKR